jgi:GAF domain-containing protein
VSVQNERRISLPPDARSPGRARRLVADALDDPAYDGVVDSAVLLTSELAENAVLHAGTEFEVEVRADATAVTVTVSDRGSGPLEEHLAQPRRRYGRAATHGRGLAMLARIASAWGTRHESDGTHRTWFTLDLGAPVPSRPAPAAIEPRPARRVDPPLPATRPGNPLQLPTALVERLGADELVAELVRRLAEVLGAASVGVEVDDGDGTGLREVARTGSGGWPELVVALPTTPPLRGRLRVTGVADAPEQREPAEMVAQRVAMAIESAWLRGVDQRRRAWMTYLAETSELLAQSLDVDLAVAVVPQVVVPRLGLWCAVHLVDPLGRLRLAALTHADEDRLPELRAVLDPVARDPYGRPALRGELRERLDELAHGAPGTARFALPTDGVAVALRARGRILGTLSVGRPQGRPHSPEDVVLVDDIARRAGLAIHNAQSTAAHVDVSQALQQALLPRALPIAPGLDLAARYLPATAGSDVGGDFYDVLTLDATRWLVSIGDVCGKGARAAARTGTVRDVLRVLVRDGRSLTRALELLNATLMDAQDPKQFCTLPPRWCRGRAGEPPGLVADLVLAGHLQPVLVPRRHRRRPRLGGVRGRVRHRRRAGAAAGPHRHPAPDRAGRRAARSTPTGSPSGAGAPGRAGPSSSGPSACSRPRGRRPGAAPRSSSRRCAPRSGGSPATRATTTSPCSRCGRRLSGHSGARMSSPPPARALLARLVLVLFCLLAGIPAVVALTPTRASRRSGSTSASGRGRRTSPRSGPRRWCRSATPRSTSSGCRCGGRCGRGSPWARCSATRPRRPCSTRRPRSGWARRRWSRSPARSCSGTRWPGPGSCCSPSSLPWARRGCARCWCCAGRAARPPRRTAPRATPRWPTSCGSACAAGGG